MNNQSMVKKMVKGSAGGILISVGCALKLAQWGLSASSVVLNGGKNMADSFAKAPELGLGSSLLGSLKTGAGKLSAVLLKRGKGMFK